MDKWKNFFLQRMGTDESTGQSYPVCESVEQWGVFCKSIPFIILSKTKEPAKRSWNDEHGDDEYIGEDGLMAEAYLMKVELCCKAQDTQGDTAQAIVRRDVKAFLDYLRTSGMMKLYSSHTLTGRQNVRLESVADNATWKQGDDGWWFLIFEVTLKVNDPVTEITLS